MDQTLVTTLAWVSKGYARQIPKEIEQDEKLMEELSKEVQNYQKQDKNENNNTNVADKNNNDAMEQEDNLPVFTAEIEQLKGENNEDENGYKLGIDDVSDEEKEDYQIKSTDALIIAGKVEKEFSSLEIYIYEQEKSNLYVHHEITLSAFPLGIEWLSIDPNSYTAENTKAGNYAIVSTFLPEIEIWDLDLVNCVEPRIILGGEVKTEQTKIKKFKKLKNKFKEGSHTDSVLSISLNQFKKNILCSGSADTTVKLWDISTQACVHTYNHHQGKVQVCKWNPKEEAIVLSAGFDKKMFLFDVRTQQNALSCDLSADIESAIWDPINPVNIVLSTEDGYVSQLDARKLSLDSIFHFKANLKETTSVSMNYQVPGCLATTSMDKVVKIWDTQSVANGKPLLVSQKNPANCSLFCGAFYNDSAWVFGCGTSTGELFIWDTAEDKNIVTHFGNRVSQAIKPNIEECNDPNKPSIMAQSKKKKKQKNKENNENTDSEIDEEEAPQEKQQ